MAAAAKRRLRHRGVPLGRERRERLSQAFSVEGIKAGLHQLFCCPESAGAVAWTGWVRRRGSEDLFGTASGRTGSYGTVFEIAKTASGYASSPATLVSFNGTDGAFPYGSLVANANGDLLGTTSKGGTWGDGTVFEIMPICFLAGTQIATPTGEVSVERLAVGERVLTHGGAARRIAWIGKGQVLATPGRRTAATPSSCARAPWPRMCRTAICASPRPIPSTSTMC
jgi:hypothetical protein